MSRYMSFVVQSWCGDGSGPMCWRLCRVHDQEELRLPDASFVVRAWIDDQEQMVRCVVRHVSSGREVQFQSGERAVEFIRDWAAQNAAPGLEVQSDGQAL